MKMSILTSKKTAVFVSYLTIVANSLSNLILTPLYLRFLGVDTYGLYQMVYSMAHYILILDFGISTTMVKYVSMYRIQEDKKAEENFAAHCFGIVLIVIALIAAVGKVLNTYLLQIYPTIAAEEASIAHTLFSIMVVTIMLTIVEHYLQGIVMAYEHFVVQKTIALFKIILKIGVTIIMLVVGMGVVAIALADLLVTIGSVLVLACYGLNRLHFRVKLYAVDKRLIAAVFTFMFAIFLQSIVAYINNMVDKTILGIMTTKADVAVYSVAMTFITLFNSLPSAISGVFLPKANKLEHDKANRDELTAFVVRPGRYQFMICAAVIAGFILFGREFISLWTGTSTVSAWLVALIIMVPNMIPLVESTVNSILDAKGKRMFRSVTLLVMSVINVGISIVLVKQYGMMGAPIGTAFSFVFGYGLIMNVYYDRVIGIDVIKMFKTITSKTWVCVLFASVVSIPLVILLRENSWMGFIIKAAVFCVGYAVSLYFYGMNATEKKDINRILRKFRRVK